MKIITQPTVWLVGKSQIIDSSIEKFMEHHELDWVLGTNGAHSDTETIPEIAGRTCYMSFSNPRPGGNRAYLEHILQVGHGSVLEHSVYNFVIVGISRSCSHEIVRHRAGCSYCLAGDTEIWSGARCGGKFNGAKKWTIKELWEYTQDNKRKGRIKLMTVMCFDGEEFVPAKVRYVVASGIKDIYKLELANGRNIRCSLDHRFLTPEGWKSLRELNIGTPIATNGNPSIGLSRDWLYKKYCIDGLMIREIAKEAKCSPHTVAKWIQQYGLAKGKGQGMRNRTPWNKGKQYTTGHKHSEETRAILSAGKTGEKNPQWRGDDASQQAGRLRAQKLYPSKPCEFCGCKEGHRHHIDRNTLNNKPNNIQFLCNSCHKKQHIKEDGPAGILKIKWSPILKITPDGREMTYDLEVDHESHNFVANGIVTHNSQLSQRYVDESIAEYVIPHEVQQSTPEIFDCWAKSVEQSHNAYVSLVNLLLEKAMGPCTRCECTSARTEGAKYICCNCQQVRLITTEQRKQVRQASRSVLPNATETKLFMSMNARAARSIIEQRCSVHADPEIRKVFYQVWTWLRMESPNLFGDYIEESLPDGTTALRTSYTKV